MWHAYLSQLDSQGRRPDVMIWWIAKVSEIFCAVSSMHFFGKFFFSMLKNVTAVNEQRREGLLHINVSNNKIGLLPNKWVSRTRIFSVKKIWFRFNDSIGNGLMDIENWLINDSLDWEIIETELSKRVPSRNLCYCFCDLFVAFDFLRIFFRTQQSEPWGTWDDDAGRRWQLWGRRRRGQPSRGWRRRGRGWETGKQEKVAFIQYVCTRSFEWDFDTSDSL